MSEQDTHNDAQHPPELAPTETYQVDSEEFDSGSDAESLGDDEYEALVQEGECVVIAPCRPARALVGHKHTRPADRSRRARPIHPSLGRGRASSW